MALNALEFGHYIDLFGEDASGFAPLHLNQVLRLIVIHHVDEGEFGPGGPGQKTGAAQGPLRPRGKVRGCQDLHYLPPDPEFPQIGPHRNSSSRGPPRPRQYEPVSYSVVFGPLRMVRSGSFRYSVGI